MMQLNFQRYDDQYNTMQCNTRRFRMMCVACVNEIFLSTTLTMMDEVYKRCL
jgi:hypothetical protein